MSNESEISVFTIVLAAVVAIATPIALWGGWYTVDEGERAVVLRNGENIGVSGAGLHFKMPLIDGVARIPTRSRTIEWDGESAMHTYSKDQQPANLSLKLVYRIKADDVSISTVYSQFKNADGLAAATLLPTAYEKVKTVFGQFNAITAVQERDRLNNMVQDAVRAGVSGPVTVESVQILNIDYSGAYEGAVEARMQAQVEVEKITQNLERERKQAEIKVVQATAEAASIRALGDARAASLKAQGEAMSATPEITALKAIEKWDGVLPTTMPPGGTVPFIHVPAMQK